MPWLGWFSSKPKQSNDDTHKDAASHQASGSWETGLNRTDWSHYTSPQTITISLITTATTLALVRLYKTYLRRIPTAEYLKPGVFRRRSLYGFVTRVGDGDNFHLYHTPGGRWMGWGWLPGRQPEKLKKFKNLTLHVRIAGVDAPELAHFGRPAQPYGKEAIEWLQAFIHHRYVRVYPYRKDQYERVVCSVRRRRWIFFHQDVGLAMIKSGLATVYEAKYGSEFGTMEEQYRSAEAKAKSSNVGMWETPGLVGRLLGKKSSFESPREYKTRMSKADSENGHTKK